MSTTDTLAINKILNTVAERRATDIHFVVGSKPYVRIKEKLINLEDEQMITPEVMAGIVNFFINEALENKLKENQELKFVYDWLGKARFRVHIFKQKGYHSVSLKMVNGHIRALEDLGLPETIKELANSPKGLFFISGPFNSGRSGTLNSLLQFINQTRAERIFYLEEPVEQLFVNDKSIIEQREVGRDVDSFAAGLAAVKDEDVDVVAVAKVEGEEVLETLLELAESGRLVLAVLNYDSSAAALDGIVSEFSDAKIQWARNVLAEFLLGLVVQRLVPTVDGEVILVAEVLRVTNAIRSVILEGNFSQLENIIYTSKGEGLISLDRSLLELVNQGRITAEEAVKNAIEPQTVRTLLKR
ncbi:MAG TPA: ATPase, T2SS/T4P/T4SS family [Patescibacteria group bacterium]|nr:ATPase, T2SS/T4P/T4SS family [Patescibacteria group bacterium]